MRAELEPAQRAALPDSLTYDMWLNAKDQIRRIAMVVDKTTVETGFSQWGRPVKIKRPGAADLVAMPRA